MTVVERFVWFDSKIVILFVGTIIVVEGFCWYNDVNVELFVGNSNVVETFVSIDEKVMELLVWVWIGGELFVVLIIVDWMVIELIVGILCQLMLFGNLGTLL
jgi:hypothetical protein